MSSISPSLTSKGELKFIDLEADMKNVDAKTEVGIYLGGYSIDTFALQVILCVTTVDSSIHLTTDRRLTISRAHSRAMPQCFTI